MYFNYFSFFLLLVTLVAGEKPRTHSLIKPLLKFCRREIRANTRVIHYSRLPDNLKEVLIRPSKLMSKGKEAAADDSAGILFSV
jgi:hypothetical protein